MRRRSQRWRYRRFAFWSPCFCSLGEPQRQCPLRLQIRQNPRLQGLPNPASIGENAYERLRRRSCPKLLARRGGASSSCHRALGVHKTSSRLLRKALGNPARWCEPTLRIRSRSACKRLSCRPRPYGRRTSTDCQGQTKNRRDRGHKALETRPTTGPCLYFLDRTLAYTLRILEGIRAQSASISRRSRGFAFLLALELECR